MRIAVSGTHFIGKTTLIEDFLKKHPDYRCEKEAYYKLQDEKEMELSLESSLDSLMSNRIIALNSLIKLQMKIILFLAITKDNCIEYTEENPAYPNAADKYCKKIYRDEVSDIFPRYGHPKIIEIWGDKVARIKKMESYLL